MELHELESIKQIQNIARNLVTSFEGLSTAFIRSTPLFSNDTLKIIAQTRFDDETIIEYLERNPDMIDNPDVRWQYQCYIWQTPIRILRSLYKNKRAK